MDTLLFLVRTLFTVLTYIFLLRYLFYVVRCDNYNPIVQWITRWTDPIIQRLQKGMPYTSAFDIACLLLVFFIAIVKIACLIGFSGLSFQIAGMIFLALGAVMHAAINIYFFAILIYGIMSWVLQGPSPLANLLQAMNEPVLRPIRRILPILGGIDFSGLVALFLLHMINGFVVNAILQTGFDLL